MIAFFCMSETTINTIVTLISIGCAIASWCFMHRSKQIKRSMRIKLSIIDLVRYEQDLGNFLKDFKTQTRKKSWNIGRSVFPLMDKMNNLIVDWNKVSTSILQSDRKKELSNRVENIGSLGNFASWDEKVTDSVYCAFLEVDKGLNEEIKDREGEL